MLVFPSVRQEPSGFPAFEISGVWDHSGKVRGRAISHHSQSSYSGATTTEVPDIRMLAWRDQAVRYKRATQRRFAGLF
jgi:hypothetical protein